MATCDFEITLSPLQQLLQVGPPETIGYSEQGEKAFRHGWNANADRIWAGIGSVKLPDIVAVRFDRVYGNLVCYPANQQAEVLARIAGTKTLLPRTLAGARALGLQVEEQYGESGKWARRPQLADFLAGAA